MMINKDFFLLLESKKYIDIIDILSGEFKDLGFIEPYENVITLICDLVETFIDISDIEVIGDKEKIVVYLTVCSLAISMKLPKESYSNIFEVLRLGGIYSMIKPLVIFMDKFKSIFVLLNKDSVEIEDNIFAMLNYYHIFIPYSIIFKNNIIEYNLTIIDFVLNMDIDIEKSMGNNLNSSVNQLTFISDLAIDIKKFKTENEIIKNSIEKFNFTFELSDKPNGLIIKKFNDFKLINEKNPYLEIEKKYNSISNYIHNVSMNLDEDKSTEFKKILGRYIKSDIDIDVKNSVNLLNKLDQRILCKEVVKLTESNSNSDLINFKKDVKDMSLLGVGGFRSFLKVLNTFKYEEIKADYVNCPSEFALFYNLSSVDESMLVKFKRFKSLDRITDLINTFDDKKVGFYFGIRDNNSKLLIEYGILYDDKRYIIGEFKFGSRNYMKLMKSDSKILKHMQEEINDLDFKLLKKMINIKKDLDTFIPGFFHDNSKSVSYISDNIVKKSFYGLGDYEDGIITQDSLDRIKKCFNDWILSNKWKKIVEYSVKENKFWVEFKIRLKK